MSIHCGNPEELPGKRRPGCHERGISCRVFTFILLRGTHDVNAGFEKGSIFYQREISERITVRSYTQASRAQSVRAALSSQRYEPCAADQQCP